MSGIDMKKTTFSTSVSAHPIRAFGHRAPAGDSTCSALVVAGVSHPDLQPEERHDKKVRLADCADVEQGSSSFPAGDVIGIIAHPRLRIVVPQNSPDIWVRATGCCGIVILLILSNIVALTTPKTTAQDRETIATLGKIADVHYHDVVVRLITAKTDISRQSTSQSLNRDVKNCRRRWTSLPLSHIEVCDMAAIAPVLTAHFATIER